MFDWRAFLTIAAEHLAQPARTEKPDYCKEGGVPGLRSWCAWTTFRSLGQFVVYWKNELPFTSELGISSIADGGTWCQPIAYDDLAHLVIPRRFTEEGYDNQMNFHIWHHFQDIDGLSDRLISSGLAHKIDERVLEVKLY